jgi:serpin B
LLRAPPPVPPEVAKYLKDGESVVNVEELSFLDTPEFNLTVYKLSSGAVLLFSKKYNAVVLGDEWIRIPGGDQLALQFYTAYYFSKEKQVDFTMPRDYNWYHGIKLYNDYVTQRLTWIGAVTLTTGIISLIITVGSGGAALPVALFLFSFTINLASTLDAFIKNAGLRLTNSPRAYIALVVLKPKSQEDMTRTYDTLNKLEDFDKEGASYLKKIANNLRKLEHMYEHAKWESIIALILASKSGFLEGAVKAIGEEKVVKFIANFITGNKDTAKDFLQALKKWGSSIDLNEKLEAIKIIENVLGDLIIKEIVSACLNYLNKYIAVEVQKTQDNLMGFFGLHCLLLGDLHVDLSAFGHKLKQRDVAPTIDNVATFYYYKIIYYYLRDELFEGLEKYDLGDIFDTGVLSFFICIPCVAGSVTDRRTILSKVQETWKNLIDWEKGKCGELTKEAIVVLGEAVDAFEKFKSDMASRRKAPGPTLGLDLVLVMDVSGSMADRFRGERKIDAAIRAASDFTKLVSPYDRVALVKFSSRASIVKELTHNKTDIISALNSLTPGGSTALGDGLWLALDVLEKRSEAKPAAVILLTDGKHNAGTRTPRESAERARKMGIRVFTLGFGEKKDIDEDTLKSIASITGGLYYYAPSPDDLRKIYAMLSGAVSGHTTVETLMGILKQGEVREIPVSVAANEGYFSVRVSYSGSTLELAARTPSGVDLDLTSSNVVYYREKGVVQLSVYNPEPGQWKVAIKAVEAAPQGVEYSAVLLKPGFTAELTRSLVYVPVGRVNETKIIVKALRDLPYIRAQLPSTLSSFATIEPSQYTDVKAGGVYEFTVKFNAPPVDVSDAILVQALDSLAWLPVQVRVSGSLAIAVSPPPSEVREGKQILAKLWVLDERGFDVPGAFVKAVSRGKPLPLTVKEGFYVLNVTGLKPGRHIIEIEASKQGYRNATATIFIRVLLEGDVNKDDVVDYRDVAMIVASYGATGNLDTDLNEDGVTDYKDLAIAIYNYGRKARVAETDPLESYTSFSLKLSLLVGLGERNTAVSPFSVYPAMLMLSEGAAGETKAEMLRALGLSSQAEAREWFKSSSQKFLSAQPPAKTSIANSLWVREDIRVKSSYAEILARYYLAEHYSFASLSEAAQKINSWVSEKTYKMIEKIVEEKLLDPRTVVVLVNAVYFKANWTTPFERVVRDTFNSPDGPVEAEYLSGTVSAKVYESEELVAVALSYNGTGVKFVALMPKKQALREFLGNISERELLGILSELLSRDNEKVKLLLPKFDVDSDILKLKPILESMGVRKVFTPMQADLSEMLDVQAYVGDVFHRARVRVDLYGTEAAAATAVVIPFIAPPSQVRFVKIDRPFAFFLVDPDTKAVLFAGSFVKP